MPVWQHLCAPFWGKHAADEGLQMASHSCFMQLQSCAPDDAGGLRNGALLSGRYCSLRHNMSQPNPLLALKWDLVSHDVTQSLKRGM